MKIILHLIIFISLTGALTKTSAATTDNSDYLNLVQQADEAIKDSRWSNAEDILLSAMRCEPANPGNILLMSNLGMVRYQLGKDSLALQTLNDAHAMAPASVTVIQNRARVLLGMGRRDAAYADFSTALSLDSTLVEARFYHAMLALDQNMDSMCISDINFLRHHSPAHRYTNLAAATYHRLKGEYTEAIPHLNHLIESEKIAEHYAARAICEMMTGDLNSASSDIAEAISLEPTDGDLYLQRAVLNKMRYRPDDAQADGQRAIELGVPAAKVRAILH